MGVTLAPSSGLQLSPRDRADLGRILRSPVHGAAGVNEEPAGYSSASSVGPEAPTGPG